MLHGVLRVSCGRSELTDDGFSHCEISVVVVCSTKSNSLTSDFADLNFNMKIFDYSF